LRDQSGEYAGLFVNEIGTCSGSSLHSISTAKNYFLDVEADGYWTIHIDTPSSANPSNIPQTFSGTNKGYSSFFNTKAGMLKFDSTYSGTSNFIVDLYKDNGEYAGLVANEIGSISISKLINVDRGKYILSVELATGVWTINVSQATTKPFITSISPSSGRCGEEVTIVGEDFGGARGSSYVTFNENKKATKYSSWNDGQITCTVPDGTTTGQVSVTKDVGTSNSVTFTVLPNSTYYFAEGTCRPGFDPYFCIQNPGSTDAAVTLTYMKGDGGTDAQNVTVPKNSRVTVAARDKLGTGDDAAHDFSTTVTCTNGQNIIAERPMYFNYKGIWTGGHDVVGF
jgi:hypothetical protein